MRAVAQAVAILEEHDGIEGIAKLAGALDNGLENRPDIGRRRGDHPQDIAAPGLIDQRVGEVAGLCLYLIEQPDVLNGDGRLVGNKRFRAARCPTLEPVARGPVWVIRVVLTVRRSLPVFRRVEMWRG